MNITWYARGVSALSTALMRKHNVMHFAADMAKVSDTTSGSEAMLGAFDSACEIVAYAHGRGIPMPEGVKPYLSKDAQVMVLKFKAMLERRSDQSANDMYTQVFKSLAWLQSLGARFVTNDQIRENTDEQKTMRIEIISMPQRSTFTQVVRNSNGEMIGSTSEESDVKG